MFAVTLIEPFEVPVPRSYYEDDIGSMTGALRADNRGNQLTHNFPKLEQDGGEPYALVKSFAADDGCLVGQQYSFTNIHLGFQNNANMDNLLIPVNNIAALYEE